MAVRHDYAQLGRHQRYFFQIRQELIEQAHGEIGFAGIDCGRRFLVATSQDREANGWIGGAEARDGRKIEVSQTSRCYHRYPAGEFAGCGHGSFQSFAHRLENALRVLIQGLAVCREHQFFPDMVEKFNAQLPLECFDLKRYGRRS